MVSVLDETKASAMLDTHLLECSSIECMDKTIEHILSNLLLRYQESVGQQLGQLGLKSWNLLNFMTLVHYATCKVIRITVEL
jgi:hypothetical protein